MPGTSNHPMKVAIVFRLDSYGGVQKCVCSLIRGLNAQGIVPDLLWDEPPVPEIVEQENVKLTYQSIRFKVASRHLVKLPPMLRFVLKSAFPFKASDLPQQYDFVYFFTAFFRLNQPVDHLFYLSGPPMLPQLENPANWLSRLFLKSFKILHQRWISPRVPVYLHNPEINYVINSQYTAQLFEDHHQVKLEVVYPPLVMKMTPGDQNEKTLITFFSRIVSYKNPQIMMELAQRFPNEQFLIMGSVSPNQEGYRQALEKQIVDLQLNNVKVVANPNDHLVEEYLSQTKIYVFPAENEHFGITTVEAMHRGAIPLVHDSGGQIEIVPLDEWRFKGDDLFNKFENILNASPAEIVQNQKLLRQHLSIFEENHYQRCMLRPAGLGQL